MLVDSMLLGGSLAVLLLGMVLNARHHQRLSAEQQETILRDARPPAWSGWSTFAFMLLLLAVQSWAWTVALVAALFLEAAWSARIHGARLAALGLPEAWLVRKSRVDLVFVLAMLLLVAAVAYPKYQLFRHHL
jgi:hypothetical protein